MPCNISQDILRSCDDKSRGGISLVLVTQLENIIDLTMSGDTNVVSAIEMAPGTQFQTYQVKRNTASFSSVETKSDAGSDFYEITGSLIFSKIEAWKSMEFKRLGQNDLVFIFKDANGTFTMLGANPEIEKSAGVQTATTKNSGTAGADLNGYTVAITGQSSEDELYVPASLIAALQAPAA